MRLALPLSPVLLCEILPALALLSRPPFAGDADDCVASSLAIHNLTAYSSQIVFSNASTGDDNSVVFQLYNSVLDVDAQCAAHDLTSAASEAGHDPASVWHGCFVESRDPRISASFQYDPERKLLTVNETWVCDTADPGHP